MGLALSQEPDPDAVVPEQTEIAVEYGKAAEEATGEETPPEETGSDESGGNPPEGTPGGGSDSGGD